MISNLQPATLAKEATKDGDAISLHRDPQTEEWVFDLSPGIDLLEIARVLNVVQQHALQLLQQQLAAPLSANQVLNGHPADSEYPAVSQNQSAQL